MSRISWPQISLVLLLITVRAFGGDELNWVQVHAEIEYTRTGTIATKPVGSFSYHLKASLDQLMARIEPNEGEQWPDYYLPSEYPHTGTVSGTIQLEGEVADENLSASAKLSSALSSLSQIWVDEVKATAFAYEGIAAHIKLQSILDGNASSNLPLPGPGQSAIYLWPTPVKFDEATARFVSEGNLSAFPPFKPRPSDPAQGMAYDWLKTGATASLPGMGGLTAPSTGAVLTGTPENWTLSLDREETPESLSGGTYSHHIKIVLSLVPRTLPIPKPGEEASVE